MPQPHCAPPGASAPPYDRTTMARGRSTVCPILHRRELSLGAVAMGPLSETGRATLDLGHGELTGISDALSGKRGGSSFAPHFCGGDCKKRVLFTVPQL